MNKIAKLFARSAILSSLISPLAMSINVFEADRFYEQKEYKEARQGYSDAAQVGNPHAYYQLGTIYYKALDVPQDNISAYIWFALASEYKFNDSEKVSDNLFSQLSDPQKKDATELLALLKAKIGKQSAQNTYFPVLNQDNLNEKVTFGGEGKLDINYNDIDLVLDDLSSSFENNSFYDEPSFAGDAFGEEEFNSTELDVQQGTVRTPARFIQKTPFLIVDYDVGPDGSIRNVTPVQKIGYSRILQERFVLNTFPAPNFKETRVNFVNRSYIGSASYRKFQMKEENERLFDKLRRLSKKLKVSENREDKYQYAMMLLTFTWLKQEEGEAEQLLKILAENNHPLAQYELGAKLYREQTNIQQAIHWISEASKYGLAKAEYMLATILQNSPWVINDEKKALFWYESAMQKEHLAATLKASELKMLATDNSLHDFQEAGVLLTSMKESQRDNPEYYFLQAIAEKNKTDRDFKQVIKLVEKAIDLGNKFNWDVSYWQGLVEKWTTGKVYIADS